MRGRRPSHSQEERAAEEGPQIPLKDPCGFYFAASCPEAFVFRAELFCCQPSAGARRRAVVRGCT